jgi:hypothetical protein
VPLTLWHRQMMFVKDEDPRGPNYFVLRDTFGGRPTTDSDLNLWFLANEMTRQGDVFHFDGQCGADMDVYVASPESFTPHTDRYGHPQQAYGRLVGFDPAQHPDGKLRETQLLLRIRQPAGAGYCVVLYPRLKENDPPATFKRLAPNVVSVETALSRDIVFLDSTRFQYEDGTVTFDGTAGTVRRYADGQVAVLNSEGDGRYTVDGRVVSGTGAFAARITGKDVTTQTFTDGASVHVE